MGARGRPRTDQAHPRAVLLDNELYGAERNGDRGRQISCLLERCQLWRAYAELLEQAGRESWMAHGAARTDHRAALNLQADAEAGR